VIKTKLIKGSFILFLLLPGVAPAGQDELNVALCKALVARELGGVKAALKKGADPKTYCLSGDDFLVSKDPAIHVAPAKPEFIEALVKAGADIDAYGGFVMSTILGMAVITKDIPHIRFLVNSGADVNRRDPDTGFTPLYYAILTKDLKVVEVLVGLGADVNAEIVDGMTMLAAAEKIGQKDIVDFLKQHGAVRGYGSPSQKAHAVSKKTPGGFRDLAWGARLTDYPGQFAPRRDNPYIYTRKSESLFFGKAKLEGIEYHFHEGRLVAIYAGTKGPDNQKALMKELEVQYGALKSHPGKPGEYYWPSFAPKEGAYVELSCMWERPRAAGEHYTPAAEKIVEERGCTLFMKDVKGYQEYVLRKK
jgi:hypothetical protein